jgi:hypothetical protein
MIPSAAKEEEHFKNQPESEPSLVSTENQKIPGNLTIPAACGR